MNNKGFTLVEILVIIAIISVMAGIFTVNMTRILHSLKESEETRLSTAVELAADAWINKDKARLSMVNMCDEKTTIYTSDLLSSGYLKQSEGVNYPSQVLVCKDSNGVLKFSQERK